MSVAGLVLAAGAGRRIGGPKALLEFGGSTLVQRCAETLSRGGCTPVVAVIGAEAARVMRPARVATRCVAVNPDWRQGVSSSLRTGLALLRGTDTRAAVVALVDQPLISAAVVERLLHAWGGHEAAVVATYGGLPRNPVLLDRSVWEQVADTAVGDEGARAWLRGHADAVVRIACDDAGAPDDIDTPEDLERLRAVVSANR